MSRLRYRLLDGALATGAVPDAVWRAGSRAGAWKRERDELRGGVAAVQERQRALLELMRSGPVAEHPEKANEQHYELPAAFFELILGPRRKYSGCFWGDGVSTLAGAEEAMLELTCQRAGVQDGMELLDLGCGWGSLSLWLAERYPNARILGVSNSAGQRALIESERDRLGLRNLTVRTADANGLVAPGRFDRVISIEMFEHMRNWHELLRRISGWLYDDGRLFVHVFSHRLAPYRFDGTWAAERFFTAGLMPSHALIAHFQDHMRLDDVWAVPGTHYARTLEAWLARLDANRPRLLEVLTGPQLALSRRAARGLLGQWRLFLISTAEIWGSDSGNAWLVSHYLLSPRRAAVTAADAAREPPAAQAAGVAAGAG